MKEKQEATNLSSFRLFLESDGSSVDTLFTSGRGIWNVSGNAVVMRQPNEEGSLLGTALVVSDLM